MLAGRGECLRSQKLWPKETINAVSVTECGSIRERKRERGRGKYRLRETEKASRSIMFICWDVCVCICDCVYVRKEDAIRKRPKSKSYDQLV